MQNDKVKKTTDLLTSRHSIHAGIE